LKRYSPSIDWGRAIVDSLTWSIAAWALSTVCFLIVATLLARYTVWGRQFWRITGDYFKGRTSLPAWGLLLTLMMLVIMAVRIEVLLSYYNNDLFSALQVAFEGGATHNAAVRDSGIRGFWMAIATFCAIAAAHVVLLLVDQYVTQRFIIRWRVWLTERLTGDWLTGRAYYRGPFIDRTIDNPDQRIQIDVDIFTTGVGSSPNRPSYRTSNILLFGSVESVVMVLSFGAILWHLSGTLTLAGLSIPRALFWIVIVYVLVATAIAFRIGHPLIRLSFRNESYNAAFRYSLVRLRDAAEPVGLYRGERAEHVYVTGRFSAIIDNYRRYVRRTVGLSGWNIAVGQALNPLPFVLQAPRLFAGVVKLGDVAQSGRAFGAMQGSLSFFRNSYDSFASYRASIMRLHGLMVANEKARALPELSAATSEDGSVELIDVEVRTPSGVQLIDELKLRLTPGDSLVVTGPSGSGKSTLLRSLAQLWPYASGTLRRPEGDTDVMFVSQAPYVPLGDLRGVVSYPAVAGDIPDAELQRALNQVALAHLAHRLDEVDDWAKALSPGEQQRVAFARILLTKPKAVFLDESTSALDEGVEYALYQSLRSERPGMIVISVSQRPGVEQLHDQYLQLLGEGAWRLGLVNG